jgi:hypothetical protein
MSGELQIISEFFIGVGSLEMLINVIQIQDLVLPEGFISSVEIVIILELRDQP